MNESRGAKYGRNLALLVVYVITSIPEPERESYRAKLIEELKKYSLEPRKKGEPRNSGGTHELTGLQTIRLDNPEHLAKLVKEGLHLMCQEPYTNVYGMYAILVLEHPKNCFFLLAN